MDRKMLINTLQVLKGMQQGRILSHKTGICDNLSLSHVVDSRDGYAIIQRFSTSWEKYSKDKEYPVPSTDKNYSPLNMYHMTKNIWVGKYGDLRKELLQHLITEITKEIENG